MRISDWSSDVFSSDLTFQPVRVDDIARHRMHSEWLNVGAELIEQVRRTRAASGRVIAVGTTVVRALESALVDGELQPFAGETRIFKNGSASSRDSVCQFG